LPGIALQSKTVLKIGFKPDGEDPILTRCRRESIGMRRVEGSMSQRAAAPVSNASAFSRLLPAAVFRALELGRGAFPERSLISISDGHARTIASNGGRSMLHQVLTGRQLIYSVRTR
jgi:hypothetical protein